MTSMLQKREQPAAMKIKFCFKRQPENLVSQVDTRTSMLQKQRTHYTHGYDPHRTATWKTDFSSRTQNKHAWIKRKYYAQGKDFNKTATEEISRTDHTYGYSQQHVDFKPDKTEKPVAPVTRYLK